MIGAWVAAALAAPDGPPAPTDTVAVPEVAAADPLAWRATPPAPGPALAFTPPEPTELTLSNGVPVTVLTRADLPLLSVAVVFSAGRATTPDGKGGLPSFTADLVDEGTANHDAIGLTDAADALGASLGTWSSGELTAVTLDTLSETAVPALDLLREVVREPRFRGKDVRRVRAETLVRLGTVADEPGWTASAVWRDEFYGSDSPWGPLELGHPDTVKRFSRSDVRDYHATWWVPGNARLYVVGDVTADAARRLLEERFGDWSGAAPPALPAFTTENPEDTRVVFVEKPGAVQSELRLGQLGALRSAPDWWSVATLNSLLGGMFSSRINLNLREVHEWSYGAWSYVTSSAAYGTFSAGASVQADATAPALAELVGELRRVREVPPSAEEVATAKDALRLAIAGTYETSDQVWGTWADEDVAGLSRAFSRDMPAGVGAVTEATVHAAANRTLAPDRLLIVVVGPRTATGDDGVEHDTVAELTALGLGPVEVRTLWE